jgi:hypothetical protein
MCIVTFHINKPLQNCDYRPKKNLSKQPFCARIKVLIVQIFYMGYSKLYYALLFDLKKVVILACVNVTIYVELELFNY